MKIILNNIVYDCLIKHYEAETVDGEKIIYLAELEKAVILNRVGSMVWNIMEEYNNIQVPLSDTNIVNKLMPTYRFSSNQQENVYMDVRILFEKLKSEGIIELKPIDKLGE